ncbi:hypothetical protein KUCAC02_028556 [Chaenocephalus aceratus]|uniref:Uncharacterized protein n=1 Tax=Chaenocephalus aceratus TaxID=36190 RepID=A0ACB9X3B7_CHAAC|nr:hypothetical protein KUCAC02_028556 [Chaenocephalus aceratus]
MFLWPKNDQMYMDQTSASYEGGFCWTRCCSNNTAKTPIASTSHHADSYTSPMQSPPLKRWRNAFAKREIAKVLETLFNEATDRTEDSDIYWKSTLGRNVYTAMNEIAVQTDPPPRIHHKSMQARPRFRDSDNQDDNDPLRSTLLLVFMSSLMSLFTHCPMCKENSPGRLRRAMGTFVEIDQNCKHCGFQRSYGTFHNTNATSIIY